METNEDNNTSFGTLNDITFKAEYKIGPFQILNEIGKGKFATVFLGIHEETKEKVAIKQMKKSALNTKEVLSNEIKIHKKLFHPNICKMYCVIENENYFFIITEYCSKGDILKIIIEQEDKFEEQKSNKIFQEIINALDYLHKNNIAHRDIKPENILINDSNSAKLSDFGLSKFIPQNLFLKTACGSPIYAAPEMLKGQEYKGDKIDIWSMGISLYTMLCGELPFDDEDMKTLVFNITHGKYILPEFLSNNAKDLIKKILEIDPEKRITIKEIKEHPWISMFDLKLMKSPGVNLSYDILPVDCNLVKDICGDDEIKIKKLINDIIMNKYNSNVILYYMKGNLLKRENTNIILDMNSDTFLDYINSDESKIKFWGGNIDKVAEKYYNDIMEMIKSSKLKNKQNYLEIKNLLINDENEKNNLDEKEVDDKKKKKNNIIVRFNTEFKINNAKKITITKKNDEKNKNNDVTKLNNLEIVNQYIRPLIIIHDLIDDIITKVIHIENEKENTKKNIEEDNIEKNDNNEKNNKDKTNDNEKKNKTSFSSYNLLKPSFVIEAPIDLSINSNIKKVNSSQNEFPKNKNKKTDDDQKKNNDNLAEIIYQLRYKYKLQISNSQNLELISQKHSFNNTIMKTYNSLLSISRNKTEDISQKQSDLNLKKVDSNVDMKNVQINLYGKDMVINITPNNNKIKENKIYDSNKILLSNENKMLNRYLSYVLPITNNNCLNNNRYYKDIILNDYIKYKGKTNNNNSKGSTIYKKYKTDKLINSMLSYQNGRSIKKIKDYRNNSLIYKYIKNIFSNDSKKQNNIHKQHILLNKSKDIFCNSSQEHKYTSPRKSENQKKNILKKNQLFNNTNISKSTHKKSIINSYFTNEKKYQIRKSSKISQKYISSQAKHSNCNIRNIRNTPCLIFNLPEDDIYKKFQASTKILVDDGKMDNFYRNKVLKKNFSIQKFINSIKNINDYSYNNRIKKSPIIKKIANISYDKDLFKDNKIKTIKDISKIKQIVKSIIGSNVVVTKENGKTIFHCKKPLITCIIIFDLIIETTNIMTSVIEGKLLNGDVSTYKRLFEKIKHKLK